jgi:hypothetical protein
MALDEKEVFNRISNIGPEGHTNAKMFEERVKIHLLNEDLLQVPHVYRRVLAVATGFKDFSSRGKIEHGVKGITLSRWFFLI